MWESRHAFPVPSRLPGGHRRYSAADADLIRDVLLLRDEGLSLPAAIERVRTRRPPAVGSVFAGLRRRRPDLNPVILAKPAVLALSRAIEDEYCAQAAAGLLIGSFQRERFYRASERRWREMARTADLSLVLAEFAADAAPAKAPFEVSIDRHHALAREWGVLVSAERMHVCLAASEQPSAHPIPDRQRRFEVLWSFEPTLVADAVEVAGELLAPLDPGLATRLIDTQKRISADVNPESARRAGAVLSHRMIGYLGQLVE
jgi:DICT domain-containing protein